MSDPDVARMAREALEDDAKATSGPWKFDPGSFTKGGAHVLHAATGEGEHWTKRTIAISHFFYAGDVPDWSFIAAARTREPLLARAYLDQLDEAAVQRERAEIAEAEVARLTERQQSHLETIRRITQTTPLDSEIATALEQRGALLAEVWTLRASRDQWSERYGADVAKLRAENAVMRTLQMSSVRPTSGQTWTEAQIHAAMYEPQGKVMP